MAPPITPDDDDAEGTHENAPAPAPGGMASELVCDVPGEFPFVNHSFGHGENGSAGVLRVKPA